MNITIRTIAKPIPMPKDDSTRSDLSDYLAERIVERVNAGDTVTDYTGSAISRESIVDGAEVTGVREVEYLQSHANAMAREYWLNGWHAVTVACPANVMLFVDGQQDCQNNQDPKSEDPSYLAGWGMEYERQEMLSNA